MAWRWPSSVTSQALRCFRLKRWRAGVGASRQCLRHCKEWTRRRHEGATCLLRGQRGGVATVQVNREVGFTQKKRIGPPGWGKGGPGRATETQSNQSVRQSLILQETPATAGFPERVSHPQWTVFGPSICSNSELSIFGIRQSETGRFLSPGSSLNSTRPRSLYAIALEGWVALGHVFRANRTHARHQNRRRAQSAAVALRAGRTSSREQHRLFWDYGRWPLPPRYCNGEAPKRRRNERLK